LHLNHTDMKKTIILTILAAALLCACDRERYADPETNPEPETEQEPAVTGRSVTVTFTATASDSLCDISYGTAALYDRQTEKLVSTAEWKGSPAGTVFSNVPAKSRCILYAISGSRITWPQRGYQVREVSIDATCPDRDFPMAVVAYDCDTPRNEFTAELKPLYSQVTVRRGDLGKYTLTANRAYVRNAPTRLQPFGYNGTGAQTCREATQSDLKAFNDGGTFTVRVPRFGCNTDIVVEGHRKGGDGIEYEDTIAIHKHVLKPSDEAVVDLNPENVTVTSLVRDYRIAELTETYFLARRDKITEDDEWGGFDYYDRIKISDFTLRCMNGDTAFTITVDWRFEKTIPTDYMYGINYRTQEPNIFGIQLGDGPVHNLYGECKGQCQTEWCTYYKTNWLTGTKEPLYWQGGQFEIDYLPSEEAQPVYLILRDIPYSKFTRLRFIDKVFTIEQ